MTFFRKFHFMAPDPATGSGGNPPPTGEPAGGASTNSDPAAPPVTPPAPAGTASSEKTPEGATLLTGKPEEKKAEEPPEEIKVTFPDGFEVDKGMLDKFLPIAKKAKLSSAAAQEFVDFYVGLQKQAGVQHVEQVTKWAEEAQSDPEIGGANFKANLKHANRVLERLGDEELTKVLVRTGLGNHKAMIRIFSKIGQLIAEDRMPGNGGAGPASDSVEEQVKAIFPNSPNMIVPR